MMFGDLNDQVSKNINLLAQARDIVRKNPVSSATFQQPVLTNDAQADYVALRYYIFNLKMAVLDMANKK
jgi:hypothetical protein